MRLLAHIDKDEGEVSPPDAVFSWGRVYSWDPYKKRGNVVSHYFRFILPFAIHHKYVDPSIFVTREGPCYWWLVRLKHIKTGRVRWSQRWVPSQ